MKIVALTKEEFDNFAYHHPTFAVDTFINI